MMIIKSHVDFQVPFVERFDC